MTNELNEDTIRASKQLYAEKAHHLRALEEQIAQTMDS
jgi:hypothetical protein